MAKYDIRQMARRILALVSIVCILVAWLLASPNKRGGESAIRWKPNVVFVVVDTLRADHLPFYGYEKDTAPFLGTVASRAVVFEKAFSASSWTAPAMGSIFTSRLPSEHGVISGFVAFKKSQSSQTLKLNALPRDIPTMGELFRAAGYRLFGIADNLNIGEEIGFDRGFHRFETYRNRGAETINAKVREWSEEIRASAPYFLYVHYMDPHQPYHRKAPWYVKGRDKREDLVNAYDSEIRHTDEHIRELFEMIGSIDETIVVFVSDHGEEFYEHGKLGHGRQLYTESIHVPLMMLVPGIDPRRISDPVHTVDILPTLTDMLSLERRPDWVGRTLYASIAGRAPAPSRPIYSELLRPDDHPKPAMRSAISNDQFHLIETDWDGGAPKSELYDLSSDFREERDLLPGSDDIRARVSLAFNQLEAAPKSRNSEVEIRIDEKAIADLRTLGYAD